MTVHTPPTTAPDYSPLLALITDFDDTALLTEIGVLLGLGLLLWLGLERLRQHLHATQNTPPWFDAHDWRALVLPAVLLPCVLIGKSILAYWQSVHLLALATSLLLSFLVIQTAFFMLRQVFKPSPRLQALQRVISWMVWGVLALHIAGYLDTVTRTLDAVGVNLGAQRLSLYSVFMGLLSLVITGILALWLARMAESRINTLPLHTNMRLALSKLARTALLALAVLLALPLVGIDITVLSVFGGALGVGLGLGLQKIASNYVSGFTLLLDQSIRIGDMVTVDGRFGEVTQIATRYTVIRGLNGTETILPNETLITSAVTNHSLSTPDNLVVIPFQVAYHSDLRRVETLLLDIARQHPRVLPNHPPVVRLSGFGESGIDLRLIVWIDDPEEGEISLVSDVNWAAWDAFQREGIEIPYPQRVVHMVANA